MRSHVTQEFFWDRIEEFARRYASIKAPAFLCDTVINEEIICVLPLISYCKNAENYTFVIDYEDISHKRAKWNATTNIIPCNGGSDVEILITISTNAHKSYKIPYPPRMRFEEMYKLLCGNVEGGFLEAYDVLDNFRVKYLFENYIEYTDIYNFYKFKFHSDYEVTEITELELR